MVDQMAESEAVIAELEMGVSSGSMRSVRATVVQASTIFYDTPATLGMHAIPISAIDCKTGATLYFILKKNSFLLLPIFLMMQRVVCL